MTYHKGHTFSKLPHQVLWVFVYPREPTKLYFVPDHIEAYSNIHNQVLIMTRKQREIFALILTNISFAAFTEHVWTQFRSNQTLRQFMKLLLLWRS